MAILDKNAYERKAEYAARKMNKNREIENNLTDEQCDAIEWICSVRHKVHSDPHAAETLWNSEANENAEYWEYIDTANTENKIKSRIEEAGLPAWEWNYDATDAVTDFDYFYDEMGCSRPEEDRGEDEYTDAIFALGNLVEQWNASIEKWLREIDEQNGTEYCPSGASRIM